MRPSSSCFVEVIGATLCGVFLALLLGCEGPLRGQESRLAGMWAIVEASSQSAPAEGGKSTATRAVAETDTPQVRIRGDGTFDWTGTMLSAYGQVDGLRRTGDWIPYGWGPANLLAPGILRIESTEYRPDSTTVRFRLFEPVTGRQSVLTFAARLLPDGLCSYETTVSAPETTVSERVTLKRIAEYSPPSMGPPDAPVQGSVERVWQKRGDLYQIRALAFSPDDRYLAVAGLADTSIGLWETRTGRQVRRFPGHREPVQVLAFSPDGRLLASGSVDYGPRGLLWWPIGPERYLRTWDVETGRERNRYAHLTKNVASVAFSPDGSQLAASGFLSGERNETGVLIFEPQTGRLVTQTHMPDGNSFVTGMVFPDKGRLVGGTGGFQGITTWELPSGRIAGAFQGDAVSLFSDGKRLLWRWNGEVFSSDLDGQNRKCMKTRDRSLWDARPMPGNRAVTANEDGSVSVWDWADGRELARMPDAAYVVTSTSDGALVASGGCDGIVRLWRIGQETRR